MLTYVLPLVVILGITVIWFLLKRKPEQAAEVGGWRDGALDTAIVILFFMGICLSPLLLRIPFLKAAFPRIGYYCRLNFPCSLALLLSFFRLRKWTATDLVFFAAWVLLLIPMFISNRGIEYTQYMTIPFQNLLAVFFVFYRMNPRTRQKTIRLFMILFNCFIFLLLALAIEEKITDKLVFKGVRDWLVANDMYAVDFVRFADTEIRFFSFWGHPLTNALLFNCFLALNTAWYRSRGKKVRALVYVPFAMAGVLLSGSKTGIMVCLLMVIIILWDYKKWLLVCIPILAILYFAGAFNSIIFRFTSTDLTSGRIDGLNNYIQGLSAEYPIRWLSGYGSGVALDPTHPLYTVKDGFEFPLLMSALDYGIVFSAVLILGSYGYITWRCLKQKQWTIWLCYSLVFAEINTYNGYSLRNQDIFIICYVTAALMMNMLPEKNKTI